MYFYILAVHGKYVYYGYITTGCCRCQYKYIGVYIGTRGAPGAGAPLEILTLKFCDERSSHIDHVITFEMATSKRIGNLNPAKVGSNVNSSAIVIVDSSDGIDDEEVIEDYESFRVPTCELSADNASERATIDYM